MDNEELRAAWSGTIDSLEKYNEVYLRTRDWLPRNCISVVAQLLPIRTAEVSGVVHLDADLWPLRRDVIREAIGVYPEPTSVLKWVRSMQSNIGLGQQFPHVSREDRTQVAFTPDATQAKADRKQRMAVGRFLRKVLLFVPESEIQRLEQSHRAEMDTTFLLAETVDAIRRVYVGMDGDTGCMRHDMEHFSLKKYHPSAVYCSPGMGVAYTEDENGTVKSRSVVWTNPDNPEDKRFVRVYGDPVLRKKLMNAGFRLAGLAGAKLRIYRDPAFEYADQVLMPWIDPAGGIHASNVDRSLDAANAIRFKGEEFITLLDNVATTRYQRAGVHPVGIQSQGGYVQVPEVDIAGFVFDCPLTGKRVNRMERDTVPWLNDEGVVVRADAEAVHQRHLPALMAHHEGRTQHVYCTAENKVRFAIPGYAAHFNDEATRTSLGLCLLDEAFYPSEARWASKGDCVRLDGPNDTHSYIRDSDAVMVYDNDGTERYVHESMVKSLKKDGCVPIAVRNSYRGLAHASHPKLAITRGGKRVITDRHEVVQLWDSTWEYNRNVVQTMIAGIGVYRHKDEPMATVQITAQQVDDAYMAVFKLRWRTAEDESEAIRRRERRLLQHLSYDRSGGVSYMRVNENIVACDYYNKPATLAPLFEAAAGIMLMKDDAEWMHRTLGYAGDNAVTWAKTVLLIRDRMQEVDREHAYALAEAHAVEAASAPLPPAQLAAQVGALDSQALDELLAQADETLATAVVRRWPRLHAQPATAPVEIPASQSWPFDPQHPPYTTTTTVDGTVLLVPTPEPVTPDNVEENVTLVVPPRRQGRPPDQRHPVQVHNDETLVAALRAIGMPVMVIDENTPLPPAPETQE